MIFDLKVLNVVQIHSAFRFDNAILDDGACFFRFIRYCTKVLHFECIATFTAVKATIGQNNCEKEVLFMVCTFRRRRSSSSKQ